MSYGIMGGSASSHLLTYQTTRPVKALYFDGESATLMGLGQLDTQMLHIFGNVSGPPARDGFFGGGLFGEYDRAAGLCAWLEAAGLRGRGWGYEGVVRMNAGFEMIWCDFASPSLRLRSRLNVTAPRLPAPDGGDGDGDDNPRGGAPMPPSWRRDDGREPFLAAQGWGWYASAADRAGRTRAGPGLGEARARARTCGLVSYYSPRLAGLTASRAADERELYNLTADGRWAGGDEVTAGEERRRRLAALARRRRYHHLGDVTTAEAALVRASSERVLRAGLLPPGLGLDGCSGADWAYVTGEIVQNAGVHLQALAQTLDGFSGNGNQDQSTGHNVTTIRTWMAGLRSLGHAFYVAFLEYPADYGRESSAAEWDVDSPRYRETYARCRYRYTRLMAPTSDGEGEERWGWEPPLSPEEQDLRWAVEETYGAICSVLLTIGFQVEAGWARDFQNSRTPSAADDGSGLEARYGRLAASWGDGVRQLLAWLGWEESFAGCAEACAWDERCYIPIWPFMSMGFGGGPGGGRRGPPPGRNGSHPHYPGGPGRGDGPPPPHGGHGGHGGGDGPGGGRPPPGSPGQERPKGQIPWIMGNETELWAPKCVKADYVMSGGMF